MVLVRVDFYFTALMFIRHFVKDILRRARIARKVSLFVLCSTICARTRPKFIGGERAHYNDDMK
jgi:uncharacterized protein YwlG (UPF0340 family)